MKKVFLTGIAALFLATGAAHAQDREQHKWYGNFRHCAAEKYFSKDSQMVSSSGDQTEVWLDLNDVLELQKLIPLLRKCTAFWQCVADREAGKVKHCYENDRRWTTKADRVENWIWRCSSPHTPSAEQEKQHEQCCKRWPNVPFCNGDFAKAKSVPQCAKLPPEANIECAEQILRKKKPR